MINDSIGLFPSNGAGVHWRKTHTAPTSDTVTIMRGSGTPTKAHQNVHYSHCIVAIVINLNMELFRNQFVRCNRISYFCSLAMRRLICGEVIDWTPVCCPGNEFVAAQV